MSDTSNQAESNPFATDGLYPWDRTGEDQWEEGDILLTNIDESYELKRLLPEAEAVLKDKKVYGGFAAWDFYANIWWENGHYHGYVMVYGSFRALYSADTLAELRDEMREYHGND